MTQNKFIKLFAVIFIIFLMTGCSNSSKFNIVFDAGEDVLVNAMPYSESMVLPSPIKEGHTFLGWYLDAEYQYPIILSDYKNYTSDRDITVYAKWQRKEYTISFNTDGGFPMPEYKVLYDTIPLPSNPRRDGYRFLGWSPSLPEKMPADDIILKAQWAINTYTISFDTNGGNSIDSITQNYNMSIIKPSNPTKEGYRFISWNKEIPTQMPAFNMTLNAIWQINSYTLSFDTEGGSNVDPITQTYNSSVNVVDPVKEGYTFVGWSPTLPNRMPAENMTLTAVWQINQYNVNYYISDEYTYSSNFEARLLPGETISQVSVGTKHSMVLTTQGRVLTWGDNSLGALGDGTAVNKFIPTDITHQFSLSMGETIVMISSGAWHSSAITSTGRLFVWGNNGNGQLGDGTLINRLKPVNITSRFNLNYGEKIVDVTLGAWHSSARTSTNRVFTWGNNKYGQVGNNSTTFNITTPTLITSRFNFYSGEDIVKISSGDHHTALLTSEGRLFIWGGNEYGQLGISSTVYKNTPTLINDRLNLTSGEKIISISMKYENSSAITSNGRLFTWGNNETGQIGDGTDVNSLVPLNVTNRMNLVNSETIESFSFGGRHSTILTSNNRILLWGGNWSGQVGDNTQTTRTIPVDITPQFAFESGVSIENISLGWAFSVAVTTEGKLYSWGNNETGQLGRTETVDVYKPTEIKAQYPIPLFVEPYDFGETTNPYTPEKEGYVFSGWYLDKEMTILYVFSNMPAEDINLYGKWTLAQ